MRLSPRAGAAIAGALAIGLAGVAFAYGPAATASPSAGTASATSSGMPPLASIRPGYPYRPAPGQAGILAHAANAGTTNTTISAESDNWAGYAAGNGSSTFRYVFAHFNVPRMDCTSVPNGNPVFSSHWVGLDGLYSNAVEQLGIEADCNGTQPVYLSWYEMYPKAPVEAITVGAGDSVTASVYYDKSAKKFTLSMSDSSNGKNFSKTVSCPSGTSCPRTSAEVISESPSGTVTSPSYTGILPLADFQAAGFSSVAVTNTSGTHRGMRNSAWPTWRLTQVAGTDSNGNPLNVDAAYNPLPDGTKLDRPTALYGGTEFLDYWIPEP